MTDDDKPKGIDSDMFLMEMGNIQRFNTLNEKLDWIAKQLYGQLELTTGWGRHEWEEYHRIFDKPEPKPEENKHKGLFLK